MPAIAMCILVIGTSSLGTDALLRQLESCGWGSRTVETLREARDLLETFRFDVVLAAESLSDGRSYELAERILRQAGSLIVGISLTESCLWLPVVSRGADVLGARAFGAATLESEIEALIGARHPTDMLRKSRAVRPVSERPALAASARRKHLPRLSA